MNKHIGLDQKLTVLQQTDHLRKWSSLDDFRVCSRCDRVFKGRMIVIWQDARGTYRLHCPTPGCPASIRDWFYHGVTRGPVRKLKSPSLPKLGFSLSSA